MKIETRLNQNLETIIPTLFIEKYNLEEGDIIEWEETNDGKIMIQFKKRNL